MRQTVVVAIDNINYEVNYIIALKIITDWKYKKRRLIVLSPIGLSSSSVIMLAIVVIVIIVLPSTSVLLLLPLSYAQEHSGLMPQTRLIVLPMTHLVIQLQLLVVLQVLVTLTIN